MTQNRGRDWYALSTKWHADPVVRAIGRECACVFALWPLLCALAHADSHADDNPAGSITTSEADLADGIMVDTSEIAECLTQMVEGELIELTTIKTGVVGITLTNYRKWNSPRGSSTFRSREHRRAGKKQARGTERDGTGRNAHTRTRTLTRTQHGELEEKDPKENPDHEITRILETWQVVWSKQRCAITGPKAKKRRDRIRARRREGFTEDDLTTAIKGWKNDPWTERENNCGIRQLLRDAGQVEKGIELATRPTRSPDGRIIDSERAKRYADIGTRIDNTEH